jgi:hypothetical protein
VQEASGAAGADPNASFIHDGSWLQVALYGAAGIAGDPELTRILLEAGADPTDERDGYHGNEILYHACELEDPAPTSLARRAALTTTIALSMLDEMVILSIQRGDLAVMRRLLDAGARLDGDPDSEEIPLGQACWRRRVQMTRELVQRGASVAFRGGGSAIGAALHGSRHCHEREGGPTMQTIDEIPREPCAETAQLLLAADCPEFREMRARLISRSDLNSGAAAGRSATSRCAGSRSATEA